MAEKREIKRNPTQSNQVYLSLHWIIHKLIKIILPVSKRLVILLYYVVILSSEKERYKLWLSDCSRVEPQERSHLDFWHVSH